MPKVFEDGVDIAGVGETIQTGEIDDNAITLAKLAHLTNDTILRMSATGVPEAGLLVDANITDDVITLTKLVVGTKGELILTDGTTRQLLAVGANDEVLIADSNETTGVKWGASAGGITASSTDTFTNKTIDANATGNVLTNIGDAEIESHVSTKITGLPAQTQALDMSEQDIVDVKLFRVPNTGELTIASGSIAVTGTYHTLDTESDASTDNLDDASGGVAGDKLKLQSANSNRDPTIVDGSGSDTFDCAGNFTLSTGSDIIQCFYFSARWIQEYRSDNN